MKLSKTQQAVLERMGAGEEVWTTGGGASATFWRGKINSRAPRFDTLSNMERAGLIEDYETDSFNGRRYRITEAGRRALSGDPQVK